MTLPDIVTILSNEPFNRPMSEIKRLTLFQVEKILLCSRDKYGRPRLNEFGIRSEGETPSQILHKWSVNYKLPTWYAKNFRIPQC